MSRHPVLPFSNPARGASSADLLRSRIAALLGDPGVAARVRTRLDRRADAASDGLAGLPLCLRAAGVRTVAPQRVKAGFCRSSCGSVDCLCGSYPRRLSDREIDDGRRLEPIGA